MTTRSRSVRRQTQWVDSFVETNINSAAANNQSVIVDLAQDLVPGITLVRTLVHLYFLPTTPGATNGSQIVSVGLGMVQLEALAGGAVADPNTSTDFPLRNWIIRDQVLVQDSIDSFDRDAHEMKVEVASQRKLHTIDSDIMLTMFNDPHDGTSFNVNVVGIIRMLFKLA